MEDNDNMESPLEDHELPEGASPDAEDIEGTDDVGILRSAFKAVQNFIRQEASKQAQVSPADTSSTCSTPARSIPTASRVVEDITNSAPSQAPSASTSVESIPPAVNPEKPQDPVDNAENLHAEEVEAPVDEDEDDGTPPEKPCEAVARSDGVKGKREAGKRIIEWGVPEGKGEAAAKRAKKLEYLGIVHAYYSTANKWPNCQTTVKLAKSIGITGSYDILAELVRKSYAEAQKRAATLQTAKAALALIDENEKPTEFVAASKKLASAQKCFDSNK
ncbi:hypothetical protein CYMTET_30912 [Cymbomonas tetramitiformis]|uniref:Uncharacterized protein n=1 Tax=Cymbomonas tetramitiformis TaxID=36881 RepID=A0AAE0FII9_9CHLO|nr:hypothetical protein CYMTET_30912 [Cymbomonas tetramitiformis]